MIYPKKISAKKTDFALKCAIILSVAFAILLIIINRNTTPQIPWAALCNAGIVYIWITVVYSVTKHTNIAAHVLIQLIALTLLTVFIDKKLGFKGWSINLSMPILLIIANITMLVLTIVSHKKYIRYAVFQLIIVVLSFVPIFLIHENIMQNRIMCYIATGISVLNFLITLILSARDVKEAVIRNFHI